MTEVITVRPVVGRLILMPDLEFQPVPKEGTRVLKNAFYIRAIQQGDLEVVPDVPDPKPTPPATPAKAVAPATTKSTT